MIDTGAPFRLGICNVVTYAAEPDSAVWRVDFECGCVGKYVCDESDDYFGWDGIAACREHERPDLPGRFNYALAYSEMEKILIDVQTEYGLGGLADGLYGDYASDVARRYAALRVAEERERCAKLCDTEAAISSGSRPTARALARKIKAGA